jgi:hypothetical protein
MARDCGRPYTADTADPNAGPSFPNCRLVKTNKLTWLFQTMSGIA